MFTARLFSDHFEKPGGAIRLTRDGKLGNLAGGPVRILSRVGEALAHDLLLGVRVLLVEGGRTAVSVCGIVKHCTHLCGVFEF